MKAEREDDGIKIFYSRSEARRLSRALQKKLEERTIEEEYLLKDALISLSLLETEPLQFCRRDCEQW